MIFREYLREIIDWNDHGFELVGLARNGIEALEMYEALQPEIILLDVNMILCSDY